MRRSPWRWVSRALLLILVVLLAVPVVTAGAVVLASRQDDRRTSDAIIVLGAAQFDGTPQPVLQARLDQVKQLFDDGVAPRIITVGGKQPGDRFTEAQAGRDALIEAGIPSKSVIAIGQGRDTFASLEAAAAAMDKRGWCTAVLVSDPWHMNRTQAMARDLGIDAVVSPTRTGPTIGAGAGARYVVRETAARLYYAFNQERTAKPIVSDCA